MPYKGFGWLGPVYLAGERTHANRLVDGAPMSRIGHLARYLGGDDDSFTGDLLRLMMKADGRNRSQLQIGFPFELLALEVWQSIEPAPTGRALDLALCEAGALTFPSSRARGKPDV